ncbi:hypothetical protein F5148DRAFT_1150115 [Russula earlei]|uniref:Uncharacterized protein n=1 Tax=Russula earlei TaxID=71964 RepID=A0ACC0U605_9AGAM|nr:hypothetical protein F5148DRAFT_1150115 [Russula earlei]
MATSRPLSISRPSKLQPKQQPRACVDPVSVVAYGGAEVLAKSSTFLTKSLRRSKQLKLDVKSTPVVGDPPVPSTPTKKRARKDTLDENAASGDAGGRLPRVRQRLVSTSSVATIRAHKSTQDVREVKGSFTARSSTSTVPRKPSAELLSARPLSEINHAPGNIPQRRLRRVGTVEFPTMRAPKSDNPDVCNQSSRMPFPVHQVSTPLDCNTSALDHGKPSKYVTRQSGESSSYAVTAAPGPAPRPALDRFDLRIAPVKEHTELWDLPDDSLHAWPGILVLTDNEASVRFPPIHAIEVECATHSYEGRFSTETNAIPVFSTRFQGATFLKKQPAESQKLTTGQTRKVRKNQWYIKFWVPIPASLFRKKDTRMFRLKASISVVDDRMWKKVTVYSGTVVADISHLHKLKDMDGAAARA